MSDSDEFHPEDYGLQPATETVDKGWRRKLEKRAQRADELEAKLAEMERREVFRDAGINPNDPAAKYFVRGYDGELTPEAIKAAAVEARIIQPSEIPAAEQQGHQAAQAAAAGAQAPAAGADVAAELAAIRSKYPSPRDQDKAQAEILALAKQHDLRIPLNG